MYIRGGALLEDILGVLAYFRRPTVPLGLVDAHGCGRLIVEVHKYPELSPQPSSGIKLMAKPGFFYRISARWPHWFFYWLT
jgi:hypothetical protein